MDKAGGGEVQGHQAALFDKGIVRTMVEDVETGDTCRICRGESTPEQPLFYPCKCSGSIKYVHQECLMEWLSHSQKKYCELCKTSFRFTKLYDNSMPESLPLPLFLRQVALYAARTVGRWLRYTLVITIWTCCLPWAIRQVWRGLFWLADGSWMGEHDIQQLMSTASGSRIFNASSHAAAKSSHVAMPGASMPPLTPVSIMFSLLTGDALLRGLLRLVTSKPFMASPLALHKNGTNTASSIEPLNSRQPSLLSDVQSLHSFTKYPALNNSLIDILEGQLVCLSVIAAFILVFLIREWVINQQPVHLMPDPDQVDAPANQARPDEDGRPGARRRRHNIRRVPAPERQQEARVPEAAQRPRAVPRLRRVPVDNDGLEVQQTEDANIQPVFPTRTSSIAASDHITAAASNESEGASDSLVRDIEDPAWTPIGLRSPPLQRGIFDEAAGIRRNIEERVTDDQSQATSVINPQQAETIIHESSAHLRATQEGDQSESFDFATFVNRNRSGEFTFSATPEFEMLIDSPFGRPEESSNNDTTVIPDITSEEADNTLDNIDLGTQPQADGSEQIPDNNAAERQDQSQDQSETQAISEANARTGILESIIEYLWHTEAQDRQIDTLRPDNGTADIENMLGRAPFVPAHPPAPIPPAPPVAAPAAVHEPNVQFGVDLNDPNAMDDAEDLEGILELIGMEGPIAGMIQNIIFSVFLITLTLSASVWCPYIWGKIALLVMSNPLGVFIKAPLFFVSKVADIVVDLSLLLLGIFGFVLTNISRVATFTLMLLSPRFGKYIRMGRLEKLAISVTQSSSLRLQRALSVTAINLRPDLPTFSMQSHHALRIFKEAIFDVFNTFSGDLVDSWTNAEKLWQSHGTWALPLVILKEVKSFPRVMLTALQKTYIWALKLSVDLKMPVLGSSDVLDLSLIEWSTKDKLLATAIGYAFFAVAGYVYLKIAHFFMGLQRHEKVEGWFADSLRQAGGVMKVIIIIGIEMIVFPLYCGCLLDIALLPLFQDATIASRLAFIANAPITGVFVHWFIGTCYMFHFALFVSMCRKIMRRGVLYFIRDPDDPTFHPVRDVLERPVATQLSKIAFSACVYGGLVILCLGGVVWTIGTFQGVLPIRWATTEPRLAIPVDIIFFNFLLPFLVRSAEPSKKISLMYEWWFRRCAKQLRLSHFLFGEDNEGETKASIRFGYLTNRSQPTAVANDVHSELVDGSWVRAPASDSVRIPRGTKVFLEVNKENERIDGETDREKGLHGKNDERFARIFIPSQFRLRIGFFIFLVWAFAASTGVILTLGPLLIGRFALNTMTGSDTLPNDLYAFTIGVHLCAALFGTIHVFYRLKNAVFKGNVVFTQPHLVLPRVLHGARYVLGLAYIGAVLGIIVPVLLAVIAELYVNMPLYNYMSLSPIFEKKISRATNESSYSRFMPEIYLVQSWIVGILYLRLIIRVMLKLPNNQTRAAVAVRAIVRNGLWHPNVQLATRALILPVIVACAALLALPAIIAKCYIVLFPAAENESVSIYRNSYPYLLLTVLGVYTSVRLHIQIEGWQTRVRDEVYLIGERLNNFSDGKSQATEAVREKDSGNVIELIRSDATSGNGAAFHTGANHLDDSSHLHNRNSDNIAGDSSL